MFRPLEKFANIATVVASGVGTADIPVAGTYYAMYLRCLDAAAAVSVANIIAGIQRVKLSLDGTTMFELNPAAIFDLNEQKYAKYGYTPTPGLLPLILCPDYFDLNREADHLAWGMANIKSFQVELQFTANIGGANQIDTIEVYVERTPINSPLGEHYRALTYVRNFPSTGLQEVTELPIEGGGGVTTLAWHAQHAGATAVLSNCETLVNNQVVHNVPPVVMQNHLMKSGWKWMISGAADDLFTIPFGESNDPRGGLPHDKLNDLRFRFNWTGAAPNTFNLIRESMHGLGNSNK